jgi:magnesium-transporting ATPase (P-type)
MKFYKKMNVKKWKNKMPTYDKETFDISRHSWNEIIQATCQSELVHEANVVLSFLPLVSSVWFGEFTVFFITSILSALFDLMFVFIQRFNRTRILKMKEIKPNDKRIL